MCLMFGALLFSQNNFGYWQQGVDYTMDVKVNVNSYSYEGTQTLVYTNNSPDDLEVVYYHLYFNAFQPGSEMDVRSLTISDHDSRVGNIISTLAKDNYGFRNVEQ